MALIERGSYFAALGEHLGAAVAGHGRLVVVGGEAGVGKTSLVRAFAEEQEGNARIAWGACDGLFTPEPLAPLLDLADELGGELTEALEQDRPRREVFAAALEELGARSTIAIVEDVHWADEATLDLLRFLGRRLEGTTALVIATYRDAEIGPHHPLRAVLGDVELARRIALPPLSEEGVRALARGSDVDPGELYRQTGGNPFYVTEVLAAGGTGVPSSVRDEYIVFKDIWEEEHTGRPSLFGRVFDFTDSPNRYGIPPFYSLHAWAWKVNPSGNFFAWNPRVDC